MTTTSSRIVVGVDGSAASVDALKWAIRYAELTGGQVEAVTSWAVPDAAGAGFGAGLEAVSIDWPGIATDSQEGALAQALPGGSGSIKRSVVFDHPAAALLAAAEGADLLVVGSRGHGGFVGMMLGSVSAHVVAHAPCPVLVIRHDADRGGADQLAAVGAGAERGQTAVLASAGPVGSSR